MNETSKNDPNAVNGKWQQDVMDAYAGGRRLTFVEKKHDTAEESIWLALSAIPSVKLGDEDSGKKPLGLLPRARAITVGLDIREYSRRLPEQQLFLSMCLYTAINRAIELLRRAGMIDPDEPRVTVQTGDGALVVFTSVSSFNPISRMEGIKYDPEDIEKNTMTDAELSYAQEKRKTELKSLPHLAEQAFSFVFALNCLMDNENKRQGFFVKPSGGHPPVAVFPVSVRYAMSYDNVLLMFDVNKALNCVGGGMVTCHRILSTDHGNHFLIEECLLRALDPVGGMNGVGGGVWEQRLHFAILQEAKVKSGTFRYADVFGFHSDGPLLRVQGRHHAPHGQFHIGSHDVGAIDL